MRDDVAVFHPGVQHSWQTALALQQLGRLDVYATSIFYQPDRWPYRVERLLPAPLAARAHREFARFAGPAIDPTRLATFGIWEWLERIARRGGADRLARRLDRRGNRRFAAGVARLVAERRPAVLWGYNNSSLETFTDPRHAGLTRILDRTIGDWRAYNLLMDELFDRYRAFFPRADYRIEQRVIDREDAEYAAADVILTGSRFAADTVVAHASDPAVAGKTRVLNYCYDAALFDAMPPPRPRPHDRPVRFVMLGQANVRKGIHLALDAFARVPPSAARLLIVGHLQVPPTTFARYADRVEHRPTVPRGDVPALLADADVLLFPSYFEGAGIVLYEALAAGCALLQSRHAALAVTPKTGLLLDELSEDTLHAAIMTMVEDRHRLDGFRLAARDEARRYRFDHYRDGIAALLAEPAP